MRRALAVVCSTGPNLWPNFSKSRPKSFTESHTIRRMLCDVPRIEPSINNGRPLVMPLHVPGSFLFSSRPWLDTSGHQTTPYLVLVYHAQQWALKKCIGRPFKNVSIKIGFKSKSNVLLHDLPSQDFALHQMIQGSAVICVERILTVSIQTLNHYKSGDTKKSAFLKHRKLRNPDSDNFEPGKWHRCIQYQSLISDM